MTRSSKCSSRSRGTCEREATLTGALRIWRSSARRRLWITGALAGHLCISTSIPGQPDWCAIFDPGFGTPSVRRQLRALVRDQRHIPRHCLPAQETNRARSLVDPMVPPAFSLPAPPSTSGRSADRAAAMAPASRQRCRPHRLPPRRPRPAAPEGTLEDGPFPHARRSTRSCVAMDSSLTGPRTPGRRSDDSPGLDPRLLPDRCHRSPTRRWCDPVRRGSRDFARNFMAP